MDQRERTEIDRKIDKMINNFYVPVVFGNIIKHEKERVNEDKAY